MQQNSNTVAAGICKKYLAFWNGGLLDDYDPNSFRTDIIAFVENMEHVENDNEFGYLREIVEIL